MMKNKLFFLPIVLLIAGCTRLIRPIAPNDNPPESTTQTPQQLTPTSTQQEATSQATQPEENAGPTVTSVVVTADPNYLLTPNPTIIPLIDPNFEYPERAIQIYRPGEHSRVTSPFRMVANLEPGYEWLVQVVLIGEDARPLSRIIRRFVLPPGFVRSNLIMDIEFEITSMAEAGRLVVSVEDEYGRIKSLSSTNLVLLHDGNPRNNFYGDVQENIIIQQPKPNLMYQGDSLLVTGLARIRTDKPLYIELVSREGKVVGFGDANVVKDEDNAYGLFVSDIGYEVSEATWVRLTIHEKGDKILGSTHISTTEFVISP